MYYYPSSSWMLAIISVFLTSDVFNYTNPWEDGGENQSKTNDTVKCYNNV